MWEQPREDRLPQLAVPATKSEFCTDPTASDRGRLTLASNKGWKASRFGGTVLAKSAIIADLAITPTAACRRDGVAQQQLNRIPTYPTLISSIYRAATAELTRRVVPMTMPLRPPPGQPCLGVEILGRLRGVPDRACRCARGASVRCGVLGEVESPSPGPQEEKEKALENFL